MTIVRAETPDDRGAVRDVLLSAFPTSAEADLVEALRLAGDVVASLVAVVDGHVAGQALLSTLTAPFRALALAPVAVAPGHQGLGIGSRLVRDALRAAREEGGAAVFVLGDPRFYERFGFSPTLASGFASPYAGPHFMVAALGGSLPATSGRIIHAPAFAALG